MRLSFLRVAGLPAGLAAQSGSTRVNLAYTRGWYRASFDGNIASAFPFRSCYVMQPSSDDERHRVVLSETSKIPLPTTAFAARQAQVGIRVEL
jgi:hypothetical protein